MNKSAHILVVDDEPDTIEILSRQLNAENYKVLKACSGKESLELLKKHKPDLILMDIMMPEMDGFETIKIIRDTVKSFIPIIIVTASKDDTESITRGFAVGANDYVVIPCHKEELLARIKAMLRIKELHDALEKRNRKLAEAYDRIKQTITERKRIEGVIRERVKELSCLYAIADLIEKEDSLEKILQGSADLMPNSWFYPEIACARITLGEQKYTTANFRETVWKQSTDINMHGKPVGVVEICYLEERPDKDEGPFLKEERNLLHVIAEWLGKVVERKWAEEALRESEERFRLAVNATKDGIWEWDIQTNQEFFSPRWCEIIGYSFDDPELPHTYTSWESRIHPDDYDRVISAMKNHLEKGTRYDVDYRHRHKSGEYRWQNSKGQAVLDESGKPIKMIGCIEDISERKQAEEALKFKNIMLATQQEVSIDGILVVDEQGKMISFNRRFADIWGIPDDILASQSDEKALKFVLAKLAEPEEFLKRVVYLYEHKQEKSREEISLKDGRIFDRYSAPMFGKEDKYYGRVWFFRDITDIKLAHEKQMTSEKLAVMGRLVADVAHELNNPLAIIIGGIQLMLSRIDEKSSPFQSQLETVLRNAQRCKTILVNLLGYGQTIGKKEEVVNLPDLIREAINDVSYQYDMSAIDVVLNSTKLDDAEITGNMSALLSVFVNLIRNARQAMGEKGRLTITIEKEDKKHLRIEIHDTGIGMSAEQKAKLFKPFISGWKGVEGSGLGLTTSLGIIETHGGTLSAESAGEGQGSTFTIILPCKFKSVKRIS